MGYKEAKRNNAQNRSYREHNPEVNKWKKTESKKLILD